MYVDNQKNSNNLRRGQNFSCVVQSSPMMKIQKGCERGSQRIYEDFYHIKCLMSLVWLEEERGEKIIRVGCCFVVIRIT